MVSPLGTQARENQTATTKKNPSGNKPLQGTDSKLTLPFFINVIGNGMRVTCVDCTKL